MNAEPKCINGGSLTGPEYPLPEDPRVYYQGPAHLVACSRVFCRRCHRFVRRWAGYRLATRRPNGTDEARELYETRDPGTSRFLTTRGQGHVFCVYACLCWADEIAGLQGLNTYVGFDDWYCHGHPQHPQTGAASTPTDVD
jgi:hypothetical protein